jgi:hypothetical protein
MRNAFDARCVSGIGKKREEQAIGGQRHGVESGQ